MSRSHPTLIFGSGNTGLAVAEFNTPGAVGHLADTLWGLGIRRLDVSSRHPPGSDYLAETLYGQAGVVARGFAVDFKSHVVALDPRGSMARDAVRGSVEGSCRRLGLERGNVFWCYAPDAATPLEEQAAAVDEQFRKGAFEQVCLFPTPLFLFSSYISPRVTNRESHG